MCMQIGGSYFRVIKITMQARMPLHQQYYPLIDSHITVKNAKQMCVNEVKRSGFLIDLYQKP